MQKAFQGQQGQLEAAYGQAFIGGAQWNAGNTATSSSVSYTANTVR